MSIYGPGSHKEYIKGNGKLNDLEKRLNKFIAITSSNILDKSESAKLNSIEKQLNGLVAVTSTILNKPDSDTRKLNALEKHVDGLIAVTSTILNKPKKDIITIWAEERDPLRDVLGWAFGNSANNKYSGYPMTIAGRILRMSISSIKTGSGGDGLDTITVHPVINGITQKESITKIKDVRSAYIVFANPIEVMAGNVINFVTTSARPLDAISVVAIIVELDL